VIVVGGTGRSGGQPAAVRVPAPSARPLAQHTCVASVQGKQCGRQQQMLSVPAHRHAQRMFVFAVGAG
jgi:hypothetical protein